MVERNFFTEEFTKALGRLSQSGYLSKINHHLRNTKVCRADYLGLRETFSSLGNYIYRRCRYVANTGLDPNMLNNVPRPLSWMQLKIIFLLLLKFLPFLLCIFLIETFKHRLWSSDTALTVMEQLGISKPILYQFPSKFIQQVAKICTSSGILSRTKVMAVTHLVISGFKHVVNKVIIFIVTVREYLVK